MKKLKIAFGLFLTMVVFGSCVTTQEITQEKIAEYRVIEATTNAQLPSTVDKITTLTKVNFHEQEYMIEYVYEVDLDLKKLDEESIAYFRDALDVSVKTSAKSNTSPAMKKFRQDKITLCHSYYDIKNQLITRVVLKPREF